MVNCICTDGIVCDSCASMQIEVLNASNATDCVALFPGVITSNEYELLRLAVTGWLDGLSGGHHD